MTVQQVVPGARTAGGRCSAGSPQGVADGLDMRNAGRARGPIGVLLGLAGVGEPVRPVPVVPRGRRPPAGRAGGRAARPGAARPASSPSTPGHRPRSTGWASTIFAGFDKLFPMDRSGRLRARRRARASPPAPRRAASTRSRMTIDLLLERRRQPAAVPAAVQLRPRQPRRRPRDAAVAVLGDRPLRRRRPLRGDLRRQLPDDAPSPCGPRGPRRVGLAADRADGPPPDPAHRAARRLARPRRGGPRLPRRPQRHRPRPPRCQPPAHRPRPARRRPPPDAVGRRLRPHGQARHGHVRATAATPARCPAAWSAAPSPRPRDAWTRTVAQLG